MTNIRTGGLLISLGVASLVGLGAGGGGDDGGGSSDSVPADALVVEALDIRFDQKEYSATAGQVPISYESKGQLVHTLLVYDESNTVVGETLRVAPGQTQVGTFDLPPGTYSLICDVPGHQDAGMTATLTTS